MNAILCQIDGWLITLVRIYTLLMIVYALTSWVPDLRGNWFRYLAAVIDPVVMPFRRIIPPLGNLDISFLVVMLILNYPLVWLISASARNVCAFQ